MCSSSKIFERLILNRISKLEALNEITLAGKQQHGFVKGKSTATAGLLIQSLIARALDDNQVVLLASLDLSAAFDIVNVDLLIQRLTVAGLPSDIIHLISIWLKERFFYVTVNGVDSYVKCSWSGIIQGSILGPLLYAIFISPLFDIENLTCYADDKFSLVQDRDRSALVVKMQNKLESVILWLTQSGMVVNETKTDLCLFCKHDCPPLVININGKFIISRRKINVLGVIFDSKLQWGDQVALSSTKAIKAINAIRLIKRYFTKSELLQLITANVYSLLFYNSEIWHMASLKSELKNQLTRVSAKALKICMFYPDHMLSFVNIHKMNNRALPDSLMTYKTAIQLYKLYNSNNTSKDWIDLNFNQILTSRQTTFMILKTNKSKVGLNTIPNRISILNGQIPLMWLNATFNTFKVKCKKLFLDN